MISDPVPFMANLAVVAHADGTLSASELGQLEAIRQEMKFKKSDYNAAIRLVENGDYRMTPVGSFADQVKNLELVLRVAYADDDLDKEEVALILAFCKTIGINQEQLNRLRNEVIASLKQQGKVCPSCGAGSDAESRFCPKCGGSLDTSEKDVQVQLQIPGSGIAIEFAESTAASFPKALEIARATDGYQTCKKGKKNWHLAAYASGELSDALPLAENLSGLRNRCLYIDGKEQKWDDVLGFTWCASERATAYRPREYCFGKDENRLNPWGCKQAGMDWAGWANWFCIGGWEKGGVLGKRRIWRFNKDRIQHELAANLFRFRFCPHMKTKLSEMVLRYLPETVDPESDANWDYHKQYEEMPGAIKVIQKERSDGFTYTNEFWTDGVSPKGIGALSDIMTKVFRDASMPQTLVKALLK